MNLVRLRNGRVRLFAGISAGLLLLIFTYVVHDTRTKLLSTRSQAQDCENRHESLSAQLQVVIEHRTRLEKTLQQEKSSHKQTKDKLEAQYEELQEQADKEKQDVQNKYTILQQQHKSLQRQLENLHEEFSKLQQINAELQEEKQNMVNRMASQMDQLRMTKNEELLQLQASISKLQQEKSEILIKMDQSKIIKQLQSDLQLCQQQQLISGKKPGASVFTKDLHYKSASTVNHTSHGLPTGVAEKKKDSSVPEIKISSVKNVDVNSQLGNEHLADPPRQVLQPPDFFDAKRKEEVDQAQEANEGHQLPNPHDADLKLNVDAHKQVERNNLPSEVGDDQKKQQIAEPPIANEPENNGGEVDQQEGRLFGHEGEVPNGLEQQENGEDQDLDDVENGLDEGRRNAHRFGDTDFDQADQEENEVNRNRFPARHQGVAAPE